MTEYKLTMLCRTDGRYDKNPQDLADLVGGRVWGLNGMEQNGVDCVLVKAGDPPEIVVNKELGPKSADHTVKLWPDSFRAQLRGECSFDLRLNDRMYQKGDALTQQEFVPTPGDPRTGRYTGRSITREILFVVNGYGLQPGYVCLQLAPMSTAIFVAGTTPAP